MTKNPWQQRIRRAEKLAAQYPFAAEVLNFYIQLATFQQSLSEQLNGALNASPDALADSSQLFAKFPAFLSLIEENAPPRFSQVARNLQSATPGSRRELLTACWPNAGATLESVQEFLALAYLQPVAESMRSRAQLQLEGYTYSLCPFCNRKPVAGVLRQLGDGGQRKLVCGFCACEWEFRRILCAACGNELEAKLPVYTAEQFPHVRVECCDACQTYIKTVDFTKNGHADPFVDELAAIPLDLWAQEHGYQKLRLNVLGM